MAECLLLIPTADLIAVELQNDFGPLTTAMIPLRGKPVFRYIAEPFLKNGVECVLAGHHGCRRIEEHLARHPHPAITFKNVGPTTSLGETVLRSLESLKELPQQVIINFADTFVGDPISSPNTVFSVQPSDLFRWTTFKSNTQKSIFNICEKNILKDRQSGLFVFAGVFSIGNVNVFCQILEEANKNCRNRQIDPFYAAIKMYFNALPVEEKEIKEAKDWRDFGHIDTYYDTKRRHYVGERSFNEVTIDGRRGIVKKTSKNTKKFIDEILWYLKLPEELQYMIPRIFEHDLSKNHPKVVMEYYGYPSLNDLYLYGDANPGVWTQIFESIAQTLKEMQSHQLTPPQPSEFKIAMRAMYEDKTHERLETILGDKRFSKFHSHDLTINNQAVMALPKCVETLSETIRELALYDDVATFNVIHGDLCLSNILYDTRSRIIRLIDPRGRFGEFDIYGDPRYDLAKLRHSLEGDYDFYVNNLFKLKWQENNLTLNPFVEERHKIIKSIYRFWMKGYGEKWDRSIALIESLLFLSMVPLHEDRHNVQEALLARGLSLYSQVFESRRACSRAA